MKLREFKNYDADIICKWIRNENELYRWSADRFNKFPLDGKDIVNSYAVMKKGGRFFPLTLTDENDEVIGHFIIRYPDENDDSNVRFGFVIINPSLRGKGIGRQMLKLGISYAENEMHAKRIDLGVFTDNDSAKHCYEAVGFRAFDKQSFSLPVGVWDCTFMELFLDKKKNYDV